MCSFGRALLTATLPPTGQYLLAANFKPLGLVPTRSPPAPAPATPRLQSVAPSAGKVLMIKWLDTSNSESQFILQRCKGASCSSWGTLNRLASFSGTKTGQVYSVGNAQLDLGEIYCYRVLSCSAVGSCSSPSNQLCARASMP